MATNLEKNPLSVWPTKNWDLVNELRNLASFLEFGTEDLPGLSINGFLVVLYRNNRYNYLFQPACSVPLDVNSRGSLLYVENARREIPLWRPTMVLHTFYPVIVTLFA